MDRGTNGKENSTREEAMGKGMRFQDLEQEKETQRGSLGSTAAGSTDRQRKALLTDSCVNSQRIWLLEELGCSRRRFTQSNKGKVKVSSILLFKDSTRCCNKKRRAAQLVNRPLLQRPSGAQIPTKAAHVQV